MQIKLTDRLRAAAELVLPDYPAADIGTDHSYLPIYLVQNGICPYMIASDIASLPYENALQSVKNLNLESQIELRLGEGVGVLKPGEVATIIIAGMGGCLIRDILEIGVDVLPKTKRLVLQPQRNADILRQWLADNSWQIVAESIVFDSGIYYEIMAAEHGRMSLSEEEAFFGPCLLKNPPPQFSSYLEDKKAQVDFLTAELLDRSGVEVEKRIQQLRYRSKQIAEVLSALAYRGKAQD